MLGMIFSLAGSGTGLMSGIGGARFTTCTKKALTWGRCERSLRRMMEPDFLTSHLLFNLAELIDENAAFDPTGLGQWPGSETPWLILESICAQRREATDGDEPSRLVDAKKKRKGRKR
eukprot:gnl/TRDRNA2_/TRDRNA2_161491_c0_seq1.p2 gnl/TRDRNA2_/TRDRNA2_161491_c0~~gnl/TRDRNA2_/TRDRNA2_161491_c0_seq1.p2  ORF type:complete len:118 (-),score=12.68 gnl/TRDRNA2_/TRDRNA2_161491_c0_seq1:117-470(-)